MLTLNISSKLIIDDSELLEIFTSRDIECQITNTLSSIPDNEGKFVIEKGYRLKMFNIESKQFHDDIWPILKERLGIVCAYVKYKDEYMGCVLNWPGVFCQTNCPGKNF